MKLVRATEGDSEIIKEFYHAQVIGGNFNYQIERTHSFFDQYRLITSDYITYLLKNPDGKIEAMSSILFRKAYLGHKEQTIGYVTDLRVSPSRKAILYWAQLFMPALRREVADRKCEFLFSTLEHFESKAYNALIRPKNRKSYLPRYHLFRGFDLVIVAGRTPFRQDIVPSIKITSGTNQDQEEITDYLKQKSVRRPLFYEHSPEELQRRCNEWPGFSMANFLVARNVQGKIIGCMAPWNNKDVQRWVVHSYHGKSQRIFQTTQTLSFFRLLKPIAEPGAKINSKLITHGAYDNPDIFFNLIEEAYNQTRRDEFLVYANFKGDFATRPPLGYIHWGLPFGLYTLLKNDQSLPNFLRANPFNPPPEYTGIQY